VTSPEVTSWSCILPNAANGGLVPRPLPKFQVSHSSGEKSPRFLYLTAVEKNQGKAWYYHHVESSNCKVFCTQQRHCDRHNYCLPHSWSQSEWKRSSFHSIKAVVSQVGALLLLNIYITNSYRWKQVKVKAPPKPLQAERSSNSDIWLLAWTLPISHEQWWVLKLQGYAKYCIRPLSSVTSEV